MSLEQKYINFAAAFPKAQMRINLADFSSIGIGGPADLYYRLEKIEDLAPLIEKTESEKIPFFVLGGGTNIIFSDEGFRGLVIHMMARKIVMEPQDGSGFRMLALDAGALLSQTVAFALKNNLAGLERLMGLPGTIGGAVRGNAGAHGAEIADFFHKAQIYSPGKGLVEAGRALLNFSYRHSSIKDSRDIIIKVWLRLEERDCAEAIKTGTEIVTKRIAAQPKGHSTGSFFKNPSAARIITKGAVGITEDAKWRSAFNSDLATSKQFKAGYLLEQCGCKGLSVGGAQVSQEHANWIMNRGNATQQDILNLARLMRERVQSRFNITLEPEVQLMGPTGAINL